MYKRWSGGHDTSTSTTYGRTIAYAACINRPGRALSRTDVYLSNVCRSGRYSARLCKSPTALAGRFLLIILLYYMQIICECVCLLKSYRHRLYIINVGRLKTRPFSLLLDYRQYCLRTIVIGIIYLFIYLFIWMLLKRNVYIIIRVSKY